MLGLSVALLLGTNSAVLSGSRLGSSSVAMNGGRRASLREFARERAMQAAARIEELNGQLSQSEMVCEDDVCVPIDWALESEDDEKMSPRVRAIIAKAKLWGSKRLINIADVGDALLPSSSDEATDAELAVAYARIEELEARATDAERELEFARERAAQAASTEEEGCGLGDHIAVEFAFKGRTERATVAGSNTTSALFDVAELVHDLKGQARARPRAHTHT